MEKKTKNIILAVILVVLGIVFMIFLKFSPEVKAPTLNEATFKEPTTLPGEGFKGPTGPPPGTMKGPTTPPTNQTKN